MTLGQRLRSLRAEKRITQQELSDRTRIPRSTIGMYEADRRMPRFDELDTLADFFDTSLDYLLGRSEHNSGYPRHDADHHVPDHLVVYGAALIGAFAAATPEIQQAVKKLLDMKD